MTLRAEAEIQAYLLNRIFGINQQIFRKMNLFLHYIILDTDPFCLPEQRGQMLGGNLQLLCQLTYDYLGVHPSKYQIFALFYERIFLLVRAVL